MRISRKSRSRDCRSVIEASVARAGVDGNATIPGYNDAQYFLLADPMDAPIVVGFLDGMESPTVETFGMDSNINELGIGFRVVHDFGCALGDYRAACRSDGAA